MCFYQLPQSVVTGVSQYMKEPGDFVHSMEKNDVFSSRNSFWITGDPVLGLDESHGLLKCGITVIIISEMELL